MRQIWTRIPWQPRRLVTLAAVLVGLWLVSNIVGGPSNGQSLICDLGGPCTAVYARGALVAGGAVAGLFAPFLIAVAGVRWIRARRDAD